ncbi:MAG: 50S ribosomal protein L5 [Candidatus Omnitrophota bacterium]
MEKEKKQPKAEPKKIEPRLLTRYRNEIVPDLMKRLNYKNKYMVPRLKKIVINVGLGEASQDAKILDAAKEEIAQITGQRPATTRAKKAIANFKIRKDAPVGCKVTLRRVIMYEFLDRLISVAIPRIKDFRGLPKKSFDNDNNYTFGLSEQLIFPEVNPDKVVKTYGMDITFVMDADTREAAVELMKRFGFPFVKNI